MLHPRSILVAAAVVAGLAIAVFVDALRPWLKETPVADIRYGVSFAVNALALLAFWLLVLAAKGGQTPTLRRLCGLAAPIGRPLLFAALIFAPAAAIAGVIARPAADLRLYDQTFLSAIFPVMEEIGFRGLAIGALMRLARWPFLPAALLPAAVFGAVHFGQGEGLAETAGVVVVTGLGGLILGWVFVRWDFNLWPAIFAHAGMNALWGVFDLGDNALGGWTGNLLRLGVIAAAVGLTLLMAPRGGRRAGAVPG